MPTKSLARISAVIGLTAITGILVGASSCDTAFTPTSTAPDHSGDHSGVSSTPAPNPDNQYGDVSYSCPGTCAVYDNMTVTVIGVDRNSAMQGFDPPTDPAGGHWVWMQVTISNSYTATEDQEVNAHDFTLVGPDGTIQSAKHLYRVDTWGNQVGADVGGCTDWSATLANSGGTFGPKPLCFGMAGNVNGPLTLRWMPRVQGKTVEIHLP